MPNVFFDNRFLDGKSHKEYVACVDIMGTRTHMKAGVDEAANFIFKLHAAIISAWREKNYGGVFVYPVMDGAYIATKSKGDMINILLRIYRELAQLFINEPNSLHRYMIRGSVAYGNVIHGHNIPYEASKAFESYLGYKDQIMLGSAMILAYDGESKAAPFGIHIDDSAIRHINTVNRGEYGSFEEEWKWYKDTQLDLSGIDFNSLKEKLENTLEEMKDPAHRFHYKEESIDNHIRLVQEYFTDI